MHDNKEADKATYREFVSKVTTGVTQIINGRRGHVMPMEAKKDLCACLNLLDATEPLPFLWDISLYENPQEIRPPRVRTSKVGALLGDFKDLADDDDDIDLDPIARPEWNVGEVRIVKLSASPYWTLARLISLFCYFIKNIALRSKFTLVLLG